MYNRYISRNNILYNTVHYIQTFGVSTIFECFWKKSLMLTIYFIQRYSKNSNNVKYFYNLKFLNPICLFNTF